MFEHLYILFAIHSVSPFHTTIFTLFQEAQSRQILTSLKSGCVFLWMAYQFSHTLTLSKKYTEYCYVSIPGAPLC